MRESNHDSKAQEIIWPIAFDAVIENYYGEYWTTKDYRNWMDRSGQYARGSDVAKVGATRQELR